MDHSTHEQSIGFGDNNANSGNNINSFNTANNGSFNTANNGTVPVGDPLRWLSPLEPVKRHHGLRSHRFEGVGDWLLETSEWREWRGGEGGAGKAVLFCSGNPGVGKTHLR